nr:hypothetical protein [Rickettsia tamurae]
MNQKTRSVLSRGLTTGSSKIHKLFSRYRGQAMG